MSEDIVAILPFELAEIQRQTGQAPQTTEFEPGYICVWNDRYFIHARATLPLKDFDQGLGFGLWVEINKPDFDAYLEAEDDDQKYQQIQVQGLLASMWPGFENVIGLEVTVRTVYVDQKVYITDVKTNATVDPIFQTALLMQKDDVAGKERLAQLLAAYMGEAT